LFTNRRRAGTRKNKLSKGDPKGLRQKNKKIGGRGQREKKGKEQKQRAKQRKKKKRG
jgi:hypothetical protein